VAPRRRRLLLLGVAAGALLAGVAVFGILRWRARPLPPFPPPAHATPTAEGAPVFDDFAGAAACARCHTAQHDAWSASTHGRAGGTPGERPPLRPFDGRPIRFADAVVVPEQLTGGALRFVVRRMGRAEIAYAVEAMVGGAHLAGGGTQAYFTRHQDGTVRMLPWELTGDGVWFCNTGTRAGRGWQPITPQMRLADCGDWPPQRVLGYHDRLASCQECHGSQIESSLVTRGPAQTRWKSLAIDCEACHGPARDHAETAGTNGAPASLMTLDKEASVQLCLRCHGLKDALQPGYLAGRRLESYYSGGLAAASGDALLPDGRTRTFAYQEGHLFSACYLNGGMTCVDCHEPHRQSYRSFQRDPLPGRLDDRQCTSCHPSKAVAPERHTRHAPESPGSRCVACHMPYLQQPDVGSGIRYARSDHTISIPRPALDSLLGVRGACAACHRDQSNATLAQTVSRWYGPLKPLAAPVAALVAERGGEALSELLERAAQHPAATLALLGRELRQRATLQDARFDTRERRALERLTRASDPDLAAAALALLHLTHGHERRVRERLSDALVTHPEPELVRTRWSALLGWLGDTLAEQGHDDRAVSAYEKALELRPGDAGVLRNLGYARLRRGEREAALATFRSAVAVAPRDALAHIALGIAFAATGNESGAADAYAAAAQADPYEPLAHFNLGNALLRMRRPREAAVAYTRAVELDPGLALAHFNLARARIALGQLTEAAAALRSGLEFDPGNDAAARLLAQLEVQNGR
jgi:Flp pilus assembly protein TadD